MQRTHRRLSPPTPLMAMALLLSSSIAVAQPAEAPPAEAEAAPAEAAPAESPEPAPEPATTEEQPVVDEVSGDTKLEALEATAPLPESPMLEEEPAAEPKKPSLVMSPSFFNRYELRRNYVGVNKVVGRFRDFDAMAFRARLKMELKDISVGKHSSLDIVLNPQASGFWEMSGNIGDQYELMMHEGYMLAHFGSGESFQLGRFEMNYGDQWLIGAVGWHQTGRTFDGLRQHFTFGDGAWLDLFGAWLWDGEFDGMSAGTDRVHDGDAFLLGAYTDIGSLIMKGMNLDIYTLLHLWSATDDLVNPDPTLPALSHDAAAEVTIGARAKAAYGVIDYRFEGGLQAGKRVLPSAATPNVLAGAADLEVGFKVHPKVRLAVEGFLYSGDDPTTAKNEGWIDRYSTAHKWNGWADVMLPRTNQMGGVFHAVASATDKTKVGMITHLFARPYLPTTGDAGYDGFEIDSFVQQALMPGLSLRGDYDVFLPGNDAYPTADKAVHYLGIELHYEGSAVFGG